MALESDPEIVDKSINEQLESSSTGAERVQPQPQPKPNESPLHDTEDAIQEEDEWEYEYDETETEDFYVTLDLSDVAIKSRPKTKQNATVNTKTTEEGTSQRQADEDPTSQHSQLQILELHSRNPIIAYEGKVYSCKWASALGTDLYFANVVDTFELGLDPLRAGSTFDLLGAGSARLVATNVELKPRGPGTNLEEDRLITERLSGRPGMGTSTTRESQMRFLERFNLVKRQRGELDRIPIGVFRPNKEFADRYRNHYTPSDDEETHTTAPTLTLQPTNNHINKSVRVKPGPRRRPRRGEQSMHGDNTQTRAMFEEEMRKHTPMTRVSFQSNPRPLNLGQPLGHTADPPLSEQLQDLARPSVIPSVENVPKSRRAVVSDLEDSSDEDDEDSDDLYESYEESEVESEDELPLDEDVEMPEIGEP